MPCNAAWWCPAPRRLPPACWARHGRFSTSCLSLPSGGSAPSSLAGFVEEVVVVCGCGVSVFCCAKYTDTLATILPPVCIMPIKCRHELLQSSLAFLRCHCCMLVLDTVFGRYIVAACACPPENVSVCATRQRELGPWWFCWVWGGQGHISGCVNR